MFWLAPLDGCPEDRNESGERSEHRAGVEVAANLRQHLDHHFLGAATTDMSPASAPIVRWALRYMNCISFPSLGSDGSVAVDVDAPGPVLKVISSAPCAS